MIRLTNRGFGLLCVAAVLLVAAAMSGLRSLAWPGGLLLGLVAAALALAWFSARNPTLQRRVRPERLPAGASARVNLDLERDSIGVGAWSVVEESVPPELTGAPALAVPSGWGWLRSLHHYQLGTHVRGRYAVGPSVWITTDPLGLASTRRRLGASSLLTVTPAIHPLGPSVRGAGAGLSGESAQLRSSLLGADDTLIREYRPRDEMRRIHWPSTARTGTLMVRREEHAWEPSALILLDNRSGAHTGHGSRSSFEWAVSAAASIVVHLLDAGYDIDLADADGQTLTAEGDSARDALLDQLTDIELTLTYDLTGSIAPGSAAKGQLLVAVLGRLTRADALALTAARHDGRLCRAIVLHPADPGSDDPADVLVASGWQVVRNARSMTVADAWAGLDWGARR
ncbi:MAG TPA: DUF58 domain-containing protein [Pseudonocardia sp.]|nr:DUF58 domain-containing protein [Pseudonocardia sp.]